MARSYSKLLGKATTSKYDKKQAAKSLRKTSRTILLVGKVGSGTSKKLYQSWDICDFKFVREDGSSGFIKNKGRETRNYSYINNNGHCSKTAL
ncbi:MAG: hypothetical protein LBQ34_02455 [Alphaproteobacteria bacterium]|jgi:hypothetical protein|nr:hypothetical protein [Alphaproteobacteria bacterium]